VIALSVVLPAFNESDNLAPMVRRIATVLDRLDITGEIIVVDDGSTDGTAAAATSLPVSLICHPSNRGYGAALRTGFAAARGQRIFFTDADQQFDLAELAGLLEAAEQVDIAVGYRQVRRDPLYRRLNALAWGGLVGRMFSLPVRDINCAFKVFRREVLECIELRSTGAFINTELLARSQAAGFTVAEIPVGHYPRTTGQSTGARPAVILRAFRELIALREDVRPRSRGSDPHAAPH
jgi:glycosyltransferase involved in cell wall biosynthesis